MAPADTTMATKFFVKVGLGPSIPFGALENAETRALAELVRTGVGFGLTAGRDFHKHFGVAASASYWNNPTDGNELTQYLKNVYIPQPLQQYVQTLQATSGSFSFTTLYLSPYYTLNWGSRLRLDARLNGGVLFSKFPGLTGVGTGTNPLDAKTYPLTVLSTSARSTSLVYGAGASIAFRVQENFHLFADVDGLRSRAKFSDIGVQGGLGPVSLTTTREGFSQTVGTLSVRFGIGLYF
ncbi:MAG: outer membrane beta-barrel protein [Cytophagaceae bacterium]|nr:outer membrane beta-barrel protein [Cytophagaceae bacterium]